MDREQLIAEISKASLRLNQQVENLLNISRLESGHIKPKNDWCDVVELVYEVAKRVEENNPQRNIQISMNQDLPVCFLDKGMLEQVVYNLLNNAAIHTDRDCRIEISATCHANILEIIIEDNGKGIAKEHIKHVCRMFYRATDDGAGSGLGLYIVKEAVDKLNGSIKIDSEEGKGTTVQLMIPEVAA